MGVYDRSVPAAAAARRTVGHASAGIELPVSDASSY